MGYGLSQSRKVQAYQPPYNWPSLAEAHVDGELTTIDFEHDPAGLVISTDAARALHRSLGKQLRRFDQARQPSSGWAIIG